MAITKNVRSLGLETLEDRRLMAGSVELNASGVLTNYGTDAADTAIVRQLADSMVTIDGAAEGKGPGGPRPPEDQIILCDHKEPLCSHFPPPTPPSD